MVRFPVPANPEYSASGGMMIRAFKKILAAVEVTRRASNQHEFNATMMREALGFGSSETRGTLYVTCWPSDAGQPVVESCEYTLYDARESDPKRSEWRLYYGTDLIEHCALAGDLMLMIRPNDSSNTLIALIAHPGTGLARVIEVFD